MKVIAVIPARFASTRFPGKPLAFIAGKPLLQWVIEAVKKSKAISQLIVATDHQEIAQLVEACGAQYVMTDPALPSGSDRVWAAASSTDADWVINIQGDEPLIDPRWLDVLVDACKSNPDVEMATLGRKLKSGDLESITTAKIILDQNSRALYFSRFPIPYSRLDAKQNDGACLKHVGVYAYKKSFLKSFCEKGPVQIELAEGLEQLRALYLGAKIQVVEIEGDSWGVDTPEDVNKIESIIRGAKDGKA